MYHVQAEKEQVGGMLNLIWFCGGFVAVVWATTSRLFSSEKDFSLKCQYYKQIFFIILFLANNIRHAIGKSQVCCKYNVKI